MTQTPISFSKATTIAINAGCEVIEETMGLTVVGLRINGRMVRHDGTGWYKRDQIEKAAGL